MTEYARPYDIVIYGASGFTGKLVAEYLHHHYTGRPDAPRWAIAGRNIARLEDIRQDIGASDDIHILYADASDIGSLAALARSAKVVISTVGPFQLMGEPMLAACVDAGTDYADLCGEPLWMQAMIEKYDGMASQSGARICFSCGFDSLPFEMGVSLLQEEAHSRFGRTLNRVRMRLFGALGAISAGTAASIATTMGEITGNPTLGQALMNPFILTPGFVGPQQPSDTTINFEPDLDSWTAPFFMATINTKNIHRSNFLRGHPWGRDFVYDEMVLTGPGPQGEAVAGAIAAAQQSPEMPTPEGGGPDRALREAGYYDLLFIGQNDNGDRLAARIQGRYDPGYGSTSRMLSETAMALLQHRGSPGIWTPFALLGQTLADRLKTEAQITFSVLDRLPDEKPQGFQMVSQS